MFIKKYKSFLIMMSQSRRKIKGVKFLMTLSWRRRGEIARRGKKRRFIMQFLANMNGPPIVWHHFHTDDTWHKHILYISLFSAQEFVINIRNCAHYFLKTIILVVEYVFRLTFKFYNESIEFKILIRLEHDLLYLQMIAT